MEGLPAAMWKKHTNTLQTLVLSLLVYLVGENVYIMYILPEALLDNKTVLNILIESNNIVF